MVTSLRLNLDCQVLVVHFLISIFHLVSTARSRERVPTKSTAGRITTKRTHAYHTHRRLCFAQGNTAHQDPVLTACPIARYATVALITVRRTLKDAVVNAVE
jgi:hypothetical protein